jgi:energy-coupling factor transporter ATP-binding protein EcfA2
MTINELIERARFTVLIGKNGVGKSSLLRTLSNAVNPSIKYVSPERGGTLKYDPNVDNTIANNPDWTRATRQTNRFDQFRQQSAALFRNLELSVLREIARNRASKEDFNMTLEKISTLLPAVKLVSSNSGFAVETKAGSPVDENSLSSGESELIALAIEVLVFAYQPGTNKLLLLDEPDVHLHPDLQQKFVGFVEKIAVEHDVRLVIATHSTAIISAFANAGDLQIVPIANRDQQDFKFFRRSVVAEEILPIFGAHPLSTAFNKMPVILVEGDDDRRVLEQVVRSSKQKFAVSPCVVGDKQSLPEWEDWLNQFLPVLYDSPKAFSLRDLDGGNQTRIDDVGCVVRMRLNCYAMENLLLCDEVLAVHGFTEATFHAALMEWIAKSPAHKYVAEVQALANDFTNRRTIDIKDVRNIVVAVLQSNQPWEVILGQTISAKVATVNAAPNSLRVYLGDKVVSSLFN